MIYVNRSGGICREAEIEKALAYVRENGASLADGKVYLDGDRLYVSIQSYKTKNWEDCKYEAHRRYIDIQYIISGSEIITVTDKEGLTERAPYSDEKDVVFFQDDKKGTDFVLNAGDYVVVFPDDVHKPKVRAGESSDVKKAVVKILI